MGDNTKVMVRALPPANSNDEGSGWYGGWERRELTDAQEASREEWKAHMAGQFTGAVWSKVRAELVASGLDSETVEETMMDAVSELLEKGWDDYS